MVEVPLHKRTGETIKVTEGYMDLNYLLFAKGIDTKKSRVLVMRHTPREPELRRALPWLAAEKPDVFNAYQQLQGPAVEKQLAKAAYLASFIGQQGSKALFVGLYAVRGHRGIARAKFWRIPENRELQKLGMIGWAESDHRPSALWFTLKLTDVYRDWKGKLIIGWPPPEISWTRWAADNEFVVKSILEDSVLDKGMDPWNSLVLTWEALQHLPRSWVDVLKQWRGIYFILDGADGRGYVGSAYGNDNLYGRWSNYGASGDGGNKLLRKRDPAKFRFSILELVSPTMRQEEVIQCEKSWKDRLHTREFGLNAN
jgi:hypothetical protein